MMTDPIADMLTRIRNAVQVGKREVTIPHSKLKLAILNILAREGYIASASVTAGPKPAIEVSLKYAGKIPAIGNLKRVSRPGHRQYVKADEIAPVLNGFGMSIISTPKGVLSDKEARAAKVGGELLCEIY